MQVDFLLIGQGICGTWLSYYLQKAGYSFIIIDEWKANSASRVAAGMINPVTGRRIVKTWMIDELLPFAEKAYSSIGNALGITAIEEKTIADFYPTPQMKLAFEKAVADNPQYLALPGDEKNWAPFFHYDFGYGEIAPCYLVYLQQLLPAWRKRMLQEQRLREEKFESGRLQLTPSGVSYDDIRASHIIFCDGVDCFQNPWFKQLPFAPNKGEILWIEAPGLPHTCIFKKGITLSHWEKEVFWAGPSYEWDFTDAEPTTAFRDKTTAILKSWLKIPFKVVDHKAALRPANLERRPFAGFHPLHRQVGIFNGMGTRGCSLAPFFAEQLVQHLQNQTQIQPEADIQRFTRILSR